MAKRKRLTPANPNFLEPAPETKSAFSVPLRAPIADVARETSATAAAEEMARTLTEAREGGRMVVAVPLAQIRLDYLVRDRIAVDEDEMRVLKDSLRKRGQQTPVELVALGEGRYGLISGWRRCAALRALHDETREDRFAQVLGLLRRPSDSAEAYQAMVEENEIRVGLSYYERARIVVKAVEQGVFDTERTALQTLFEAASRAKRSKIGSFVPVVQALECHLRFPDAMTERQGLTLSRALSEEPAFAARLAETLRQAAPDSPEAEAAAIDAALSPSAPARSAAQQAAPAAASQVPSSPPATPPAATPRPQPAGSGVYLSWQGEGRLVIEGRAVDARLHDALLAWLRNRL